MSYFLSPALDALYWFLAYQYIDFEVLVFDRLQDCMFFTKISPVSPAELPAQS